jgi:glycosyltransferase involved in cell wall biosynthesis
MLVDNTIVILPITFIYPISGRSAKMDAQRKDVVVLIPAFNEELTIATVVMLSRRHSDHVIVIDDGSTDRTRELASEAGAEVLSHTVNKGKAAALMTGFARARELKPKVTITIDADGQMDPGLIPSVAEPVLQGVADLVIGSRYIGRKVTDTPKHRRLGQKVLNRATTMGASVEVTDSQSGYRALSLRALNNTNFNSDRFNIESEMITYFSEIGLKIMEVPVSVRYDVPSGHKQKPLEHGLSVLGGVVSYIGYRRPLLLFGVPGAVFLALGMVVCVATFIEVQILFDWTLVTQGIAGIFVLGMGVFLFFAALVLNSLSLVMRNVERSMMEHK